MKFKYSAIGDNTQENREWLEKLGYKPLEIDGSDSMLYTKLFPNGWMFSTMWNFPFPKHYIDCRSNPQLFQAVTAMREDSDYMQWFVITRYNEAKEDIVSDWRLCKANKFDIEAMPYSGIISHHKATLEELQEHFK